MKENVGQTDQTLRAAIGPLLLTTGYLFGGRKGRGKGLMTMLAGAMITETAITKTCPLNRLFGIDTTQSDRQPAARPTSAGGGRGASRRPGRESVERSRRSGLGLDFSQFVNAASGLSFIQDKELAEAAVKAVIGILASRLEEPEAQRLVATLPDPLSLENLRGHQAKVTDLSVDNYYGSLASQFDITAEQAQVLAVTILRLVKEALDTDGMRQIERSLPEDWTALIERV
ncbi:MAG: DUF2267 domain-containing protein [Desulfuromonadales bacterium]